MESVNICLNNCNDIPCDIKFTTRICVHNNQCQDSRFECHTEYLRRKELSLTTHIHTYYVSFVSLSLLVMSPLDRFYCSHLSFGIHTHHNSHRCFFIHVLHFYPVSFNHFRIMSLRLNVVLIVFRCPITAIFYVIYTIFPVFLSTSLNHICLAALVSSHMFVTPALP